MNIHETWYQSFDGIEYFPQFDWLLSNGGNVHPWNIISECLLNFIFPSIWEASVCLDNYKNLFRYFHNPVFHGLHMEGPNYFMDDFYNFHVKEGVTVGQIVSDEIKELAAPHWLSFPPSHPFIADFIAILYSFLCFCNISANGFLVFLFIKESSLRTPSMTNIIPISIYSFFGNYWSCGSA